MTSIESQSVTSRLSRAAIFLVATLSEGEEALNAVRALSGDLAGFVRAVGFRDLDGGLSCIMGFGSDAWDRLFAGPRPQELHPFQEIKGKHRAVATPGDILFHIRASSMDLCFELAMQIIARLGAAVTIVDETHGFKFFDQRDMLGFVDGTENPVGQTGIDAVLIAEEDPPFAGGSYMVVQKYLHDLKSWNDLAVERQEAIIGRRKLSDIEIEDAAKEPFAHNVLTSINDQDGNELKIVRDNMPFGTIGKGEFGTYFIGYARSPARIERMLQNMFVGDPPGNYDRILDFSSPVTGSLFFVPAETFLGSAGPAVQGSAVREST